MSQGPDDAPKYVFAPGGSAWGTSYEFALRPALTYRILWCALTTVFMAYLIGDVRTGVLSGWDSSTAVKTVAHALPAAACAYIAARTWTTRVWVSHSFEPGSTMYHQYVLHQTKLGRRSKAWLRSPGSRMAITGSAPFGPRPGWKLTVTNTGQPPFVVGTPWQHDLSRLLELLWPVVSGDRALVADEQTWGLFGGGHGRRISRRPKAPPAAQ